MAQPQTIALVIIVVLLLMISETMRATGQMEKIVSLAKSFFRRPAVTMAALPALIGLLPMPGGALFSAPLVEAAAGEEKVYLGRQFDTRITGSPDVRRIERNGRIDDNHVGFDEVRPLMPAEVQCYV